MVLELTPIEYVRFTNHCITVDKLRDSHTKITPAKEAEVLAAMRAGISSHGIQRALRVSNKTIIRVRKKNGLWGV